MAGRFDDDRVRARRGPMPVPASGDADRRGGSTSRRRVPGLGRARVARPGLPCRAPFGHVGPWPATTCHRSIAAARAACRHRPSPDARRRASAAGRLSIAVACPCAPTRRARRRASRPGRASELGQARPTTPLPSRSTTRPAGTPRSARRNGETEESSGSPAISVSSSARRSRSMAASRSPAWTMILAIRLSYSAGTRSPSTIPVSTRTPGPAGITQRRTRPGVGMKSREGSSAAIRTSIAWLAGSAARSAAASAAVGQWTSRGQPELFDRTMSSPDTSSVTPCSTCSRVLTSRK